MHKRLKRLLLQAGIVLSILPLLGIHHPAGAATVKEQAKPSCCTMVGLLPRPSADKLQADPQIAAYTYRTFDFLYTKDATNAFVESSLAVRKFPQSPVTHYLRGAALMTMLDFAEASNEFNKSLVLDPNFSDAHFMLGQAYRLDGRFDEAISEFNLVLKENPNHAAGHALIGECNRAQGHFWTAETKCREAMQIDPKLPLPHTILAYTYALQDKAESCLNEHQAAILLAPEDPYVHFRLGQSLSTLKRWTEAETALRKSIEFDPKYADALMLLSWVLLNEDKLQQALDYGKEAVKLAPTDVDAHNALALMHIKAGNHDLAVQEYKVSRTLRPKSYKIQRALAMELCKTEKIDEAIIELSLTLRKNPLDEEMKLALNALLQIKMKERSIPADEPVNDNIVETGTDPDT